MRRRVFSVLVVLLLVPGLAFAFGPVGTGLDLGFVQDFVLGQGSRQLSMDFRAGLAEDFQVRLPIAITLGKDASILELGMDLVYYPWLTGPFMGLSMFRLGFTSGCHEIQNLVNLNQVMVGWTFNFGQCWFVEPCICIRDPSGTFTDEYSRIKGAFPCYTTFRVQMTLGWNFWR